MYNATPLVKEAWNRLFASVFLELRLDVELIDHSSPLPIESLWTRPDLLCAFMCGWPFINSAVPMKPIVVPVPAPPRYQDQSRYCSEFLARGESGWTTLQESFGHRFGFMTENSQSGFNAPRGALAVFARQQGGKLFSAVLGGLSTPAGALEALRDKQVDVIALDSFYLDLLRAHRPEALYGMTSIASTDFTPMPLLVAASSVSGDMVAALVERLTSLHRQPNYADLLANLLVRRFEVPDIASYARLNEAAASARQSGYEVIA